jgi:hypothetical protein
MDKLFATLFSDLMLDGMLTAGEKMVFLNELLKGASFEDMQKHVPKDVLLDFMKKHITATCNATFLAAKAEKDAFEAKQKQDALAKFAENFGLKPDDVDWDKVSKQTTLNLASKPVDAKLPQTSKTTPKLQKSNWVGLAKGMPTTKSKDGVKSVNPKKKPIGTFEVPVPLETELPKAGRQTSVFWLFAGAGIKIFQPPEDTFYEGFVNGKPVGWLGCQQGGSTWNSSDDGKCYFVCPKDKDRNYAITVEADSIYLYKWHSEEGYIPTTLDKVVNGLGIVWKPPKSSH